MRQLRFLAITAGAAAFLLYALMQMESIYAGDSGELVAAAVTFGIAHPPGYPLYGLLGGLLVRLLPVNTIPWRVGLLSSLPMALSVVITWMIAYRMSKNRTAATISSAFYAASYPVWLYAIAPEVFGLYAFFSALILWVFLVWRETKRVRLLFFLAFLWGLSLTHHHLILFLLLPMLLSFLRHHKSTVSFVAKRAVSFGTVFLLGFSFYLYAPIASLRYPPLDWEHSASPAGFLRLVTRASYGTFRATMGAGQSLIDRVLNSVTFFHYVFNDFTAIGVLLACAGLLWLHRKDRALFSFFAWYAILLAFFFFYAGFPGVTSNFILGTVERFFIVPYQVLAIMGGVGLSWFIKVFFDRFAFPLVFFVAILTVGVGKMAIVNYQRLAPLRTDQTMARYLDDMIASIPPDAIVDGTSDSFYFPLQYAHWGERRRRDIHLIRMPQLIDTSYRESVRRWYPDIAVPDPIEEESVSEYVGRFVASNAATFPIVREKPFPDVAGVWLPHGLVFRYYPAGSVLASVPETLDANERLWDSFSDPLFFALSGYRHLLLSDVARIYAQKRISLARSYLEVGNLGMMERELREAYRLMPYDPEAYVPMVLFLVNQKRCDEALAIARDQVEQKQKIEYVSVVYHELYETCGRRDEDVVSMEHEYQKTKYDNSLPIQ